MPVKALMVDVDGVLVDGRPQDGHHWNASIEEDLGFTRVALQECFFAPYWEDIVCGRTGLLEQLTAVLPTLSSRVSPADFITYWFERDSRIVPELLAHLARVRAAGIRVYLTTNQEHLRAAYLMEAMRLADHVDGIFYSARLGVRKPELAFFTTVRAVLGLAGDEMLLIDDSASNVEAAQRAGWRAAHWTTHSSPDMLRSLCL